MSSKQEQDAADKKAERARAAAKAKAEKERAKAAEDAEHSVSVRAVRKGFYPADGRLRDPNATDGSNYFDYVRVVDPKTGELEPLLPSWMEDVSGEIPSREEGVVPEHRANPGAGSTITRR